MALPDVDGWMSTVLWLWRTGGSVLSFPTMACWPECNCPSQLMDELGCCNHDHHQHVSKRGGKKHQKKRKKNERNVRRGSPTALGWSRTSCSSGSRTLSRRLRPTSWLEVCFFLSAFSGTIAPQTTGKSPPLTCATNRTLAMLLLVAIRVLFRGTSRLQSDGH